MEKKLEVSVTIIVFNRPEVTRTLFSIIEKVKPTRLFIISDAPREGNKTDIEKVQKCREIVENINWECEVSKNYAEQNMGCDNRIVSGINWVFNYVNETIILEDDCIPNISFFYFCQEMLKRYEFEENIMYISGTKWVNEFEMEYSYDFSYATGTWGWATWKRAWNQYEFNLEKWNKEKINWMKGVYSKRYRKAWTKHVDYHFERDSYPWDWIWRFNVGDRLSIVPNKNLIVNIGFGEDSTHTKEKPYKYVGDSEELGFPLIHPVTIGGNKKYAKKHEKKNTISILTRVRRRILRKLGRI